jgi:tRNA(fMet)-specific endonuclease VapC
VKYLVESDRAIDYLKGRPDAVRLLQALAEEGLALSVISYGEIYEGIYFGSHPRQHERDLRRFLQLVRVLPLTQVVLRRYAQIRGRLRQQGTPIGELDTLVAATALHHNLTLVTRNRRHFDRVPGLKIYEDNQG